MPPFQYTRPVDPYVGSIAELMGQQGRTRADAAERIAAIRAQEAAQRGQAWSGAIQGIGDRASKTITEWNSPEARRQRELDKARGINRDRGAEMQSHIGMRRVLGHAVPEIVPPEQTDPVGEIYRNALSGLGGDALVGTSPDGMPPVDKYGNALLGGDALVGTSPDTSPLSRGLEGAFGTVREGRTPDDLEAYDRDPVGRYTTKNGLYDIKLAYSDLLEKGISPEVANMIAKQGLEANTIFSAADDIAEKFRESKVKVRGTIAQMAIALHEASPGMSWDEALENTIGPGMSRENPEELQAFQNMFVSESPEGKENILRGYVDQWNRQGDPKVVGAGAVMYGSAGEPLSKAQFQTRLPTAASLSQKDYQKYLDDESNRGTPAAEILSFKAWEAFEGAEGLGLSQKERTGWVPRIVNGKLSEVIFNPPGWPKGVYNSSMERIEDPAAHVFPVPATSANSNGTSSLIWDPSGHGIWANGRTRTIQPALNPDGSPVRQALTAANRTMKTGAQNVQVHIPRILELARELDSRTGVLDGKSVPLMGVFGSRVREAFEKLGAVPAGEYGSEFENPLEAYAQAFGDELNALIAEDPNLRDDVIVGEFASNLSLLASGAGRVHGGARGGGSITMINYMKTIVSATSNYAQFFGRMRATYDWMDTYARMGEAPISADEMERMRNEIFKTDYTPVPEPTDQVTDETLAEKIDREAGQ